MTRDISTRIPAAQERLEAFVRVCREMGLKATHQRMEIYRELAETEEHPDAETIYLRVRKRIPAISFDTVYRTLRTLQGRGLIARVGVPQDTARFDANMANHHHFVCERCGAVRDFLHKDYDRLSMPNGVQAIGVPRTIRVEVRGLCHACRDEATKTAKRRASGAAARRGRR